MYERPASPGGSPPTPFGTCLPRTSCLRYNIRTVRELLGHKDLLLTMIYTHVLNRGGRGVRSPAEGLVRRPDER